MRTILTYGTFDLFHIGHLNLLKRLSFLGDRLGVGVSTDEFNRLKGKTTVIPYADRVEIVRSIRCVDFVFPEECWEQKQLDIKKYNASVLGMGHDWKGKFDQLANCCEIVYLDRTEGISSSEIKQIIRDLRGVHIQEIKRGLDLVSSIVEKLT